MVINDSDNGWESIALTFVAARSNIGCDVIRRWAKALPPGGEILDIGCGSGIPIASALREEGFTVFGIDASQTLVSMFRQQFGDAYAACETVENSSFFGRSFDGAVAIGLMFLLSEHEQRKLINKVGTALRSGGLFLFSAPRQKCEWSDMQTGQRSVSLGEAEYVHWLAEAGMQVINTCIDEGENHYFEAKHCSARTASN